MYIRRSVRTYKGKTYTNYVLVEAVQTPKGPRQKTICSLGDLSPRPREEWLKLAHKLEHALAGQGELLEGAVLPRDPELDGLVSKIRGRRRPPPRPIAPPAPPPAAATADGGYIAVDPRRVATEQHREAGSVHSLPRRKPGSATNSGAGSDWMTSCATSVSPAARAGSPAPPSSIG
jgi:hypothetical protein